MHLMHVHVYYDELQNLPLGKTANIRSRNKNVSIAQEQDLKYPDLCVVFVPYSKLESERINGKFWLFYCGIEKEVYFWRIPVEKLRSIAKRQFQDENKKRFVLYLNYKTGELFHLLSLQCCATCMKTQSKVFDRLIIDTSADRHLAAKK